VAGILIAETTPVGTLLPIVWLYQYQLRQEFLARTG
jgi:hypothetical protein